MNTVVQLIQLKRTLTVFILEIGPELDGQGHFRCHGDKMIIDITKEIFIASLVISIAILVVLQKKTKFGIKAWVVLSFIVYLICLLKITIFPIVILDTKLISELQNSFGEYFVFYQLKPFYSIQNYFTRETFKQLFGNLILLAPFAVYLEVFSKSRWKFLQEAITLTLISAGIELLQLIIGLSTGYPNRICDIDDIILNSTGAILTLYLIKRIVSLLRKNEKCKNAICKMLYNDTNK